MKNQLKKHKTKVICICVTLLSLIGQAQQSNESLHIASLSSNYSSELPSSVLTKKKEVEVSRKVRAMKGLRKHGIILSSLGSVALIGGTIMATGNTKSESGIYQSEFDKFFGQLFGEATMYVGGAGLLAGTTMWIIGQRGLNKEKNKISFNLSPNSVYLSYTF